MAKKVLSKAYRHHNQRQSHEPENTSAGDEKSIPNPSNEMAQEKGRSQPRRPFRNKSLGDAKADHRVGRRRRSSSKGADGSPPSSPRTRQARRRSKAFRDLLGEGELIAAQQRQRQKSSSRDKTSSQIGKQPSSQDENSKESFVSRVEQLSQLDVDHLYAAEILGKHCTRKKGIETDGTGGSGVDIHGVQCHMETVGAPL